MFFVNWLLQFIALASKSLNSLIQKSISKVIRIILILKMVLRHFAIESQRLLNNNATRACRKEVFGGRFRDANA